MKDEVTPDSLMDHFKGQGLKRILIFTLVVHAVVILGSSIPYFIRKIAEAGGEKGTEAERIEKAVGDATAAIRKIAKKHGLNPQDISDQFSGGGSRAGKTPAAVSPTDATSDDGAASADTATGEPEPEKSDYEKNLTTKVDGPSMPSFADDKDDIF